MKCSDSRINKQTIAFCIYFLTCYQESNFDFKFWHFVNNHKNILRNLQSFLPELNHLKWSEQPKDFTETVCTLTSTNTQIQLSVTGQKCAEG